MRDNSAVIAKRKETTERRSLMKLSQYECKIQKNKLSNAQETALAQLFRQAKWLYNAIVTSEDVFKFDTKITEVVVKTPYGTEVRKLDVICAQAKQDILKRAHASIKTLAKLKKQGRKVGKLKPVRVINSIPMRQKDVTYKIICVNKLKLAGIPGKLRLNGLDRIPKDAEWANARLVRRPTGLYVTFIVYENQLKREPKAALGADFGVKTGLTFSNGIEIDTSIPIDDKIKNACHNVSKSKLGSKSRRKAIFQLQKQHQLRINKVKETRNQILNITRDYAVAIQDDTIQGWQRLWGSKVLANGVGAIKQGWKTKPSSVTIDRFVRTTNVCRMCGSLLKLSLNDRVINCACGHVEPRDLSAARTIGFLAIQQLPAEHRSMPLETKPNTEMLKRLQSLPHITARLVDDRKESAVR